MWPRVGGGRLCRPHPLCPQTASWEASRRQKGASTVRPWELVTRLLENMPRDKTMVWPTKGGAGRGFASPDRGGPLPPTAHQECKKPEGRQKAMQDRGIARKGTPANAMSQTGGSLSRENETKPENGCSVSPSAVHSSPELSPAHLHFYCALHQVQTGRSQTTETSLRQLRNAHGKRMNTTDFNTWVTGAAASQCVTPSSVRQFGGLYGGGDPTPLRRGGGGAFVDPNPAPGSAPVTWVLWSFRDTTFEFQIYVIVPHRRRE